MPYPTPSNPLRYFEDGGSAITTTRYGAVSGSPRVVDCGAGPALFDGVVIADFSALDHTSGNEAYTIKVWGSNSSDFSSGTPVELLAVTLNALPANNQQAYFISNQADDVIYRYLRAQFIPAGTTPSVTLDLWLLSLDDLDELSQAQLVKMMAVAATRFGDATEGFRAWAGGTATGGPNSDGEYPLYDGEGNTYLVPCPAKIALTAGLSWDVVDALTQRTTPFANTDPGPNIILDYSSALRKGKLYLFAARRTQDLDEFTGFLTDELIPSWRDGGGGTGIERKIAVREIMRQTSGFVNPIEYGVVPDAGESGGTISFTSGNTTINCDIDVWKPSDVGKPIAIGNALSGGGVLRTTIASYINAHQITVTSAPTRTDAGGEYAVWGTINTAAMQAALDACMVPGAYTYGKVLLVPTGAILTGCLQYRRRTAMFGHGVRQSSLIRWDDRFFSSTYGQNICQYQDGSYYFNYYPFYDDPDSTLPMYKPTTAPLLANAQGYFYDGTAGRMRPNGNTAGTNDANIGYAVDADFNAFGDFSINGSKYTCSGQFSGFEFRGSIGGGKLYWQVDPFPIMTRMHVHSCGFFGIEVYARFSGTIAMVDMIDNNVSGMNYQGFDGNIINLLSIGNNGPGIVAAGTNSNWINIKISYSGKDGSANYLYGQAAAHSNLYVPGNGHNFENCRLQESNGNNLLVDGKFNVFTGCNADDTGCIIPVHSQGSDMPPVMAAVYLGGGADFTRLNDFGYGGQVHPSTNYATHALFFGGDAQYCTGRIFTKLTAAEQVWYTGAGGTSHNAPAKVGSYNGSLPTGTVMTVD